MARFQVNCANKKQKKMISWAPYVSFNKKKKIQVKYKQKTLGQIQAVSFYLLPFYWQWTTLSG